MANWNNPLLTSTYVNFVAEVRERDEDVARQFDPATTSPMNVPNNTVRWNGGTTRWERWNGTVWNPLASSYAINISGNAATATVAETCTGNAATATVLQTGRTINGTSFNGGANITTANWGTARTLTIGNTGKSVNGSANVSWTLAEIGALSSADAVTLAGSQTISGQKTFSADTFVGTSLLTAAGTLELGIIGTGDRPSFVDFHSSGAPGAIDFSARIIRGPGVNGTLLIQNTGGGQIALQGAKYAFSDAEMPAPVGTAPLFMCRAWVNFNGTGTPAIRASGNVSSITRNGTGYYTVNFTTAMPDANYVVVGMGMLNRRVQYPSATFGSGIQTASSFAVLNTDSGTTAQDDQCVNLAVFR